VCKRSEAYEEFAEGQKCTEAAGGWELITDTADCELAGTVLDWLSGTCKPGSCVPSASIEKPPGCYGRNGGLHFNPEVSEDRGAINNWGYICKRAKARKEIKKKNTTKVCPQEKKASHKIFANAKKCTEEGWLLITDMHDCELAASAMNQLSGSCLPGNCVPSAPSAEKPPGCFGKNGGLNFNPNVSEDRGAINGWGYVCKRPQVKYVQTYFSERKRCTALGWELITTTADCEAAASAMDLLTGSCKPGNCTPSAATIDKPAGCYGRDKALHFNPDVSEDRGAINNWGYICKRSEADCTGVWQDPMNSFYGGARIFVTKDRWRPEVWTGTVWSTSTYELQHAGGRCDLVEVSAAGQTFHHEAHLGSDGLLWIAGGQWKLRQQAAASADIVARLGWGWTRGQVDPEAAPIVRATEPDCGCD